MFKRKVEAMVENDEGLQELAEQEQWNTCLYIPSDEVRLFYHYQYIPPPRNNRTDPISKNLFLLTVRRNGNLSSVGLAHQYWNYFTINS